MSPYVRENETLLNPGFHAVGSGFQALGSSPYKWNLDSGFQILWAVFQIQEPRIQDSISKLSPDSGFHKQKFHGSWNPDSLTWGRCDTPFSFRSCSCLFKITIKHDITKSFVLKNILYCCTRSCISHLNWCAPMMVTKSVFARWGFASICRSDSSVV